MSLAELAVHMVAWCERLAALAVLLEALEMLIVRRAFADDGIFRFSLLAGELRSLPLPLRVPFMAVLPAPRFVALQASRVLASVALGSGFEVALPWLCFAQLAVSVRFRGTYNGGSDSMLVLVLLALTASWAAGSGFVAQELALAYIAVQLTLSYFVAGLVKLKEADWRSGHALCSFAQSGRYGAPAWLVRALSSERRCFLPSWAVILFECAFPVAWLSPRHATVLLALGLGFHAGNVLLFGLNRFFFAWASAYPALLFASQLLFTIRKG